VTKEQIYVTTSQFTIFEYTGRQAQRAEAL
jgi:hypothetical protein